ncbi:hypothetical protein M6B38_329290 [Iris pallida]|uniref:Uncharacterized protein n=1 Tax=Iris pallida TaxID=29817 RepID=A0AAX6H4V5_IRIPA|nr:hypothetical protein M6B38_329290 [Iris pallida]
MATSGGRHGAVDLLEARLASEAATPMSAGGEARRPTYYGQRLVEGARRRDAHAVVEIGHRWHSRRPRTRWDGDLAAQRRRQTLAEERVGAVQNLVERPLRLGPARLGIRFILLYNWVVSRFWTHDPPFIFVFVSDSDMRMYSDVKNSLRSVDADMDTDAQGRTRG